MNWGKSIIACFVLFAVFIGVMVYRMATTKIDLVKKNYYEKEVVFQQQIDREKNTSSLKIDKIMCYSPETQTLRIGFPTQVIKGMITFFRPSDKSLDFSIPIQKIRLFEYSTQKIEKGRWKIQSIWTDGTLEYYKEEDLFVQ